MKDKRRWPLQEAKNKFSQVAEEAALYGPQLVTKRGKDALVILSLGDYERLQKPKTSLVQFLKDSPLSGSGLDAARCPEGGRKMDL